jgi:cysteine desulfuration protein SufE
MDSKEKTEDNLIEGCQSKVWLNAKMDGDKLVFTADSDAIITKGLVALLLRVLSGRKPEEIKNANLYFIDEIGLKENLSPTRSNGLVAMINKIKAYAMAYELKKNP